MKRRRPPRRHPGFTLVELLVVIAIIGVLVALLLPAVQSAREAARRAQCMSNVKNISLGALNYESSNKKIPYGRKFDRWDSYTWSQLVLPYIEQQAIYQLYWTLPDKTYNKNIPGPNGPIGDDPRLKQARHSQIPLYYCPSGLTPTANEMNTEAYGLWRSNYRGCVGSGDIYGTRYDNLDGPAPTNSLIGAFAVTDTKITDPYPINQPVSLKDFDDGASNTLFFSEALATTVPGWGGPMGSAIYGNMGGALFSAHHTPNSSQDDAPRGPCPDDDGVNDTEYPHEFAPCTSRGPNEWFGKSGDAYTAARSFHAGGVVASMVDGSVRFVSDSIEVLPWRYMATRSRADANPAP